MVEYSDDITAVIKAISDPVRRELLDKLRVGDKNVSELAESYDMSFAGISKHIQVLLKAKLVTKQKQGREVIYSINSEPLMALDNWLMRYRDFWNTRLDALEQAIREDSHE